MLPVANPIALEWNDTILTLGLFASDGEESIKAKVQPHGGVPGNIELVLHVSSLQIDISFRV